MRNPLFWIPGGLLAAALGLSIYQISNEVHCGGRDAPRLIDVWFYGTPAILLVVLLVAPGFLRGKRMWAMLLVLWLVVFAVYAVSFFRQLGCLS